MLLNHDIPAHLNPLYKYPDDYPVYYADHLSLTTIQEQLFRLDFGRAKSEKGVPSIEGHRISEVEQRFGILLTTYTLKQLEKLIGKHMRKHDEIIDQLHEERRQFKIRMGELDARERSIERREQALEDRAQELEDTENEDSDSR